MIRNVRLRQTSQVTIILAALSFSAGGSWFDNVWTEIPQRKLCSHQLLYVEWIAVALSALTRVFICYFRFKRKLCSSSFAMSSRYTSTFSSNIDVRGCAPALIWSTESLTSKASLWFHWRGYGALIGPGPGWKTPLRASSLDG